MTLTDRINAAFKLKRDLVGWLDHTDLDVLVERDIPKRIGNSTKAVLVEALVKHAGSREDVRRELRMRGIGS